MKTDLELQLALARMLPEKIKHIHFDGKSFQVSETVFYGGPPPDHDEVLWKKTKEAVKDTEWLHVCWLIEQELTDIESQKLKEAVYAMHKARVRLAYSASWQQRATALIAVKGEK